MFPWTHPQVHPSNKFLVWSPHYIKLLCFLLKLQSNKINNDKYFYPHKIWYKTSNPILLKQRTQNVWLDLVQYFPFHFLLVQIDRLNKVTGAWTTPCCWHFVSWRIFWYISKLYFPLYTVPDVPTHLSKVLNPLINYENQGFWRTEILTSVVCLWLRYVWLSSLLFPAPNGEGVFCVSPHISQLTWELFFEDFSNKNKRSIR